MYAYLTYRSRVAPLLIEINTRYGWVASPYPTGTCTPQETPSFARRDNVPVQARRHASADVAWNRLLGGRIVLHPGTTGQRKHTHKEI